LSDLPFFDVVHWLTRWQARQTLAEDLFGNLLCIVIVVLLISLPKLNVDLSLIIEQPLLRKTTVLKR
jgi:hypothetical protein